MRFLQESNIQNSKGKRQRAENWRIILVYGGVTPSFASSAGTLMPD
jgi:hypothetical protein